ncbi:MAG: hypothetical protein HY421_01545 [Candidatus Kerfeldbacteria bacterium]|nr:hypothetical protein [Candidatus Kerfeldbacteria bacterium]
MKCPRCGANNPRPEMTLERCVKCNFLLTGEVHPSMSPQLRKLARQRRWRRLGVFLVFAVPLAAYVWSANWFGMLPWQQRFTVSAQPTQSAVLGAGSIPMNVGGLSALFSREALWSIDAIVLGRHDTRGWLMSFAPQTVVAAWGPAADVPRPSVAISASDAGTQATSSNALVDQSVFKTSAGALRILATNQEVQQRLARIKSGDRVHVEAYLASGSYDSQRVVATIPASGERGVPQYLLEVTYLEVNGQPVR